MLPVKYWKFSSPLTRSASSPCSAIAVLALAHRLRMSASEKADHRESLEVVMWPSVHAQARTGDERGQASASCARTAECVARLPHEHLARARRGFGQEIDPGLTLKHCAMNETDPP